MSDSFEKIHIKDDRLSCSSKIKYGVVTGPQSLTSQSFKAISESTSACVFNVAVPSLETIISREILFGSTMTIAVTCTGKPAGEMPVNIGVTDALNSFPLLRAINNITVNINNNSVSTNMSDIIEPMLRLLDPEELAKYESTTPTTLNYLANLRDGVEPYAYMIGDQDTNTGATVTSPPTMIKLSADGIEVARANDHPATRVQSFYSYPNNVLAYDYGRPAGSSYNHRPRGSFKILRVYAKNPDGSARNVIATDTIVYIQFRTLEPLMISPFIWGDPSNKAGMYGIQNIAANITFLSNCNRSWSSVSTINGYTKTAQIVGIADSTLYMQFLTPKASDMLESRNVVPYYQMPIFKSSNYATMLGRTSDAIQDDGSFVVGDFKTITSNSIQLSVVPDKLVIFARRLESNLNCCQTSSFLTINKVQINWNNQAGLLSTMTAEQLYKASITSGLSNLTYDEFTGLTVSVAGDPGNTYGFSQPRGPLPLVGAGAYPGQPGFKYIPTTGSILVLDMATVVPLQEQYYAPGSIGQFNLQVTVDVANNHKTQWDGSNIELCIIPIMSGSWINERGTSSSFIGLLTKADVLDTIEQEAYTQGQVRRLIGGSFMDRLKSGVHWITSKLTPIKHVLEHVPHEYAQRGAKVLDAMGYGKHGRLDNRLQ